MPSLRIELKRHTHQAHENLGSLYPLCNMQHATTASVYFDSIQLLFHWHRAFETHFSGILALAEYKTYEIAGLSTLLHRELLDTGIEKYALQGTNLELKIGHNDAMNHSYFMGWLYVILGSSMGAIELHNNLSKHRFYKDLSCPYYSKMADYSKYWIVFQEHLEQHLNHDEFVLENVLLGATDGFASLISMQQQLYSELK